MTKLSTPSTITRTTDSTAKTITLSWDKPSDYAAGQTYSYSFISKADPEAKKAAPSAPSAVTVGDKTLSTVFTCSTDADFSLYGNYYASIMTAPAQGSTDTSSDWGSEIFWIAGPTLTVEIGGSEYTLSQNTLSGVSSTVYRMPVSEENPITLLYADLQSFASTLNITLPSNYPNGAPIASSLDINEFVIDTGKKLLSLNIVANIGWGVIPGLTIKSLGLALKRTDGSL